jgi:phosphoglucosamine mutase
VRIQRISKRLQKTGLCEQADFGLRFDGDGDRLMAIDKEGIHRQGDMLMLLFAKYLKKKMR